VWNFCHGYDGGDDVAERSYRKRRRVSENQEIEDRLESLILRVGEKVCYTFIIIGTTEIFICRRRGCWFLKYAQLMLLISKIINDVAAVL
jgi:hypothetical protein